jgi:solute carrier organic anion transporter family, member 3A
MTGLYSAEAQDDSSADLTQDTFESVPNNDNVNVDDSILQQKQAQQPQNVTVSTTLANPSLTTTCISSNATDSVIKSHSRQPSNSADKNFQNEDDEEDYLKDCGILSCRPAKIQKLARIKVGF